MNNELKKSRNRKIKRKLRVRRTVRGNAKRPRLCVVKSNKHIQAQLIDDQNGVTIVGVSTTSKEFKSAGFGRRNKESAKKLGEKIAELAKKSNIEEAVFDRGPFKYNGILAELAGAARENGLKI